MELNENTQVKLDLKTIAIIVAGALSVASTYFTLQSKIDDLNYKISKISMKCKHEISSVFFTLFLFRFRAQF